MKTDGSLTASNATSCSHRVIQRCSAGVFGPCLDSVIQEQMLDVYVNGASRYSMTCSPWDIEELVVGQLFLRGEIGSWEDVAGLDVNIGECRVDVFVSDPYEALRAKAKGESGVISFADAVEARAAAKARSSRAGAEGFLPAVDSELTLAMEDVTGRIALLEEGSELFHRTGGVHSAVLADDHGIVAWFEDIGRHSALDKLIGWCVIHGVSAADKTLLFSGRVPYEIITKAIKLGCPAIISPGAPTGLSIDLAQCYGVTLIGFAKKDRFNVYSHPERIKAPSAETI